MKIIKLAVAVAICLFFISGCGTKRQYFEPIEINGEVRFDGRISSNIKDVSNNVASMEDGGVVLKNGAEKEVKTEEGYVFLGEFNDRFVISSRAGNLKVIDQNGNLFYEKNFGIMIASASIDGSTLAVVTADNMLHIFDMNSGVNIFQRKMDAAFALDSRMAAPYFLGSLVIFPTLDGKLAIVDRNSGTLIRNVVVSSKTEFNNVIFLDVVEDKMFAATTSRMVSISPASINFIEEDIKDALLLEDRVFVFTKDGSVILLDLNLKVLETQKFPFALFAGSAAKDGYIYAVEKRGYIIKSDIDLKNYEVFDFPTNIDESEFLFMGDNAVFYGDRFYTLK